MRKRLIVIAVYSLFWLLFFFFARLFFIIVQHESSFSYSLGELVATFFLRSKTGYLNYRILPGDSNVADVAGNLVFRKMLHAYSQVVYLFFDTVVLNNCSC